MTSVRNNLFAFPGKLGAGSGQAKVLNLQGISSKYLFILDLFLASFEVFINSYVGSTPIYILFSFAAMDDFQLEDQFRKSDS